MPPKAHAADALVLKKSPSKWDHKAIVVINKVGSQGCRTGGAVLNETFDLFIDSAQTDRQADFPVIYAQATAGRAGLTPDSGRICSHYSMPSSREIPRPKA